jgi:acetyl-CoA carboxylase biotin carboxyl carrier protein
MAEKTAAGKAGEKSEENKAMAKSPSEPSFNLDELRELADLVNQHGFTDFEFENENIRVRLSKQAPAQFISAPPAVPVASVQQDVQSAASPSTTSASGQDVVEDDAALHKIVSPIVGTFYRSPAPDKPPYVTEGSKVTPETIVCIVEAMKLMNEIQAETTGEIVKIYVENGEPVEFGQPLFGVRKQ